MNEVERWYDEDYEEWDRLARHKIEFDITKRYLDEYITESQLSIMDIGGGPGRYAIYLAEKGHKVTLLDLSKKNIEVAKVKASESGVELEGYLHGNALDLDGIPETFDVVLLMGPLYHLIYESDRKRAVREALKRLKPGGLLVASFISKYAPIQDHLKDLAPFDSAQDLLGYLHAGENKDGKGFTTAYFTDQKEAQELMASFGLQELIFAGVENVLGSKEIEINQLEEQHYKKWLEIGFELSKDENVIGTSQHYLYIGRKSL